MKATTFLFWRQFARPPPSDFELTLSQEKFKNTEDSTMTEKIYKNEDYTARSIEQENGETRYFIKFHSATTAQEEVEVSHDYFALYVGEFKKPLVRNTNEKRRHLSDCELGDLEKPEHKPAVMTDFTKNSDFKISVEAVLKTCTPTQQKRFTLYHDYGYNFAEIAKAEDCNESAIRKSVRAVEEKIKNIFS
jgi:RNA polymerase sigma-70 factor (ECF subfamily)